APAPGSARTRLVNGSSSCSGRVEVLHNGMWGTVCNKGWNLTEAQVVCEEVGCGHAVLARVVCSQLVCGASVEAPGKASFGQGHGPIWLDEVNCTGAEGGITECSLKPWGAPNCSHGEDAGVVCSDPTEVRLVNGPNRCAGRLEVLHNQQWGSVCSKGWDMKDAAVVCRQLGCGPPISTPGSARFGRGHDPIWLETVSCQGTEAALSECRVQKWGSLSCHHGQDASVVCSDPMVVRVENGPNRCSGRVEVLHQQQWGTVCDDGWDLPDAEVVCWELGCGAAIEAPGKARFGRGQGSIWLDEGNC
ncbi:PREDICTED: CD5 antigen-like, partial [Buceros rhinoceros silvestris]|uniref:CD5 antigen-like n=1 Tax=Buceros rhinoceros silvestris TaxID=175836 RepID=UPI0005282DEE